MTEQTAEKLASYVGLSQRAGAVIYGEDLIEKHLNACKIVLVDSHASAKYIERIQTKFSVLPIYVVDGLREALHRESVNAIAITNENLANAIQDILR